MNKNTKKVILFSSKNYSSKYEGILLELLKRKIELFCAVGKDCAKWEDAIDWLYVQNKKDDGYHITTTCHPDETLEEVKEFAKLFVDKSNCTKVQIIEI
jgi:hypothetical protein